MGDLGDGTGSSYPAALDSNSTLEVDAASATKTKARAAVPNDLMASIVAVQTTLGTNPHGSAANLKTRLAAEHNADGAHNDAYIVNVSGTQTILGIKTFSRQILAPSGISVGASGIIGTASDYLAGRTTVGASGAMWFQDDIRTSGSMRGTRNPTHPLEYANKQYVDSRALQAWTSRTFGVTYQAGFDTLVTAYVVDTATTSQLEGDTDGSNPPTTIRAVAGAAANVYCSISFPVKKNDYWRVVRTNGTTSALFELPMSA